MKKLCHVSVLMDEVVDTLKNFTLPVFVEGTLGAGGHAAAILSHHPEIEKYIGFDQDEEALAIAKEELSLFSDKVIFAHRNFTDLDDVLKEHHIESVNGFFFDLGVSSMQLDRKERGFSFKEDAPLDMRMNKKEGATAADLVNEMSEHELEMIFKEYGEVPFAKSAAKAIAVQREKSPIETTKQLATLIEKIVGGRGKIHPATLIFQALRIAVNKELESIQIGLEKALKFLAKGGVMGVISFHSLEDRIVKNLFRQAASLPRSERGKVIGEAEFELLNKKPIVPSFSEVRKNVRSRSAKLRWVKRREA